MVLRIAGLQIAGFRAGSVGTSGLRAGGKLAAIALALLAWQGIAELELVHSIILPPPSAIVRAGIKDWQAYLGALRITFAEILAAMAIAWFFGVGLGVILGSSIRAMRVFSPLLDATFALPWVVFFPLAVVWFGIGSPSKILFAGVHAIFPILLATAAAVSIVEDRYLLLARALGATRLQVFTKVLLPFALPQIVAGLRVGTGLVVIGVIVGEMLSSFGGIGYMISYYREIFEAGHVYLGILLGLLIAGGTNALMTSVERRVANWRA